MTTAGYKIWWKKYLTTLQISQFVIDLFVVYFASASRLSRVLTGSGADERVVRQPTRTLSPSTSPDSSRRSARALEPRAPPSWAADSSRATSSSSSCVPSHPAGPILHVLMKHPVQAFYKKTYNAAAAAKAKIAAKGKGPAPSKAIAEFKKQ